MDERLRFIARLLAKVSREANGFVEAQFAAAVDGCFAKQPA